jgi:hypothetical protein
VALQRRSTAELLAEELRRLDNDDIYQQTVLAYARSQQSPAKGKRSTGTGTTGTKTTGTKTTGTKTATKTRTGSTRRRRT